MFHRTLRPDDPRWGTCDPDYTLSEALFVESIGFFRRHYNVVSLEQVLHARRVGGGLPPRALLITFDDGWLDNVDYALPALSRMGLPGVMFVATDAVGAHRPFFQERLIAALRRGTLRMPALADDIAAVDGGAGGASVAGDLAGLRGLIARLEHMSLAARQQVLDAHADALRDDVRQMVDVADLARLRAGGVELGLHGKSHVAMKRAEDLDAELGGARAAMATMLGAATPGNAGTPCATLSFPHGSFDEAIAARARDAGYELLFTSVPVLNPVAGGPSWLLGRTGYETDTIADRDGVFRPERLAWYLFRRETRRLA